MPGEISVLCTKSAEELGAIVPPLSVAAPSPVGVSSAADPASESEKPSLGTECDDTITYSEVHDWPDERRYSEYDLHVMAMLEEEMLSKPKSPEGLVVGPGSVAPE